MEGERANVVGQRIGAAVIDIVVLTALFFGATALTGNLHSSGGQVNASLNGGSAFAFFAVLLLYYGVTEAVWQATPGKALLGLRVVNATDATKPAPGQVTVRTLMRIIDALPILYLVGFVVVLGTGARQQRIGDLLANTTVAHR
jgi:uncharacterized RDD family membrane protein YckC